MTTTTPAAMSYTDVASSFRGVLSKFATGVTVVTAIEDSSPVGFTCQAFTSLSLDPPMVALAPAKTSTSWPRIARAGAFCINILSDEQSDLCSSFAVTGTEKFAGVQWRRGRTGAPVLEGVVAWIECQLGAIHDAGDHELVLGHVVAMGTGAGDPLLYYQSRFHSIAS